jgi:hypothetical protein
MEGSIEKPATPLQHRRRKATQGTKPSDGEDHTRADQIKVVGGLIALGAGLIALLVVLVIGKWVGVSTDQFTQLGTTIIGVIASITSAYFGVKIGTDGTQRAIEAQRQEAARSQIFAAHLDPNVADKALELAFPQGGFGEERAHTDPSTPRA